MTHSLGSIWRNDVVREELIVKALVARYLFRRGEQYLVRDGVVHLVDEYTGRVMVDRRLSDGIHQMIEIKEKCDLTGDCITVARTTYQMFFRRYLRLSGMSGTCIEVSKELWRVYKLAVTRIPAHKRNRLVTESSRVLVSQSTKWRTIARRVRDLHSSGCAILLGTRTVKASETAAVYLAEAGIPFVLLNAAQDAREAEVVEHAGVKGRVTISTNMSGRGTDIWYMRMFWNSAGYMSFFRNGMIPGELIANSLDARAVRGKWANSRRSFP